MPDVHLAAGVSNGVVVATNHFVYPAAVGGDIGCGFAVVSFLGSASPLNRRAAAEAVLASLPRAVPVMRHRRRSGLPELCGDLDARSLSRPDLVAKALSVGREELGTLGRGNHFLEFQQDDEGRLWAMVHSGSRAMGQHITAAHLQQARAVGGGLAWLDADTGNGQAYLNDVAWARRYASESRRRMLSEAATIIESTLGLRPDCETWLDTDHNHVQREEHGGNPMWVHRKGANVARSGLRNVIPGSMATHTYHVEGRGERASLSSSSHGAGRRLSRGAARTKVRRKDLSRQFADIWIDAKIMGKLADESPAAYKDIDAVMRAQRELVRIVRRLRPIVCYKGV
ncbi:MAG: RtcB family protein [Phycisphaerae bacterium]|nr:RtcB family protein [Phycisphaerae bacterium]